jgi:hypothetical protein
LWRASGARALSLEARRGGFVAIDLCLSVTVRDSGRATGDS